MSDKEEDVDRPNTNTSEVNEVSHSSGHHLQTSSSSSILSSTSGVETTDCNFIERMTPKVLFVRSSLKVGSNQLIQKDLPVFMRQELGMVPPPSSLKQGMQFEHTGLDKFRKYLNMNRTYPEVRLGDSVSRHLSGAGEKASVAVEIGSVDNVSERMTSRPPVLGHASSSSNESGSAISGSSGNESEDVPASAVGTDNEFVYTDMKMAAVANREDYISVKPPEGSLDQSIQMDQPPSSASSVASVSLKPLEWDSGADVGYYQIYSSNNSDEKKLSTIERIAIATGSAALLTRLEPEGTTEYISQQANTMPSNKSLKKDIKNRLGLPVAESTPFSTNQSKTDTPSGVHVLSGSEDELSPIIPAISEHLEAKKIDDDGRSNELARKIPVQEKEKLPRPLFPEIKTRNSSQSAESSQSPRKNKSTSSYFKPVEKDINKVAENDSQKNLDNERVSENVLKGIMRKHFSSSMENLRDNEIPTSLPTNNQFNTLPRSQSHSNVVAEMPESFTLPKHIIYSHYLLQGTNPTKSASSSSISTVVQKRKDSPKHISKLVQTSFVNQSIGVQATESSRCSDSQKSRSERSQSLKASSSLTGFSIQNFQYAKPSLVSSHQHDGNVCTGAHRKVLDTSKRHTSHSTSSSNQPKVSGADNECGTLDSVTSSVKTENQIWADRHESIGVEDRANSFEYLPGHMYENAARPDDASGESSSISLNRNASSQNELSDDKSWEQSNSSTFARDIERGVDMMLNFVHSSQVRSSELKKKLMKRVAEKLISTDIASGCSKNASSIGSLSEDRAEEHSNGRETRRSLAKDDIPCQESPFTSDRTSSRTSSECFKPKSSFSPAKKFTMKDVLDKCVGTERTAQSSSDSSNQPRRTVGSIGVQCESISSNEVSKIYLEKSPAKYRASKECTDYQDQQNDSTKKRQPALQHRFNTPESSSVALDSNRSSSVEHSSTDWRPAMPVPTTVFEQKRKCQAGNNKKDHNNVDTKAMINLLSFERDNQRLMIQSEIEHLDYLRRLLKKQEELRDSLARIQKTRQKHLDSRYDKCKTANESNKQMLNSIKNRIKQYPETYNRRNSNTAEDHQEWDSHNYYSSTDEMNKQVPKKVDRSKSISRSQFQQTGNVNNCSGRKSQDSCKVNQSSASEEEENHTAAKLNGESSEILATKAVTSDNQLLAKYPTRRSSKSSASGAENRVCSVCKKKQSCKCSRNNRSLEKNKKAVAYFITFEEGCSENNSTVGTDTSLEEVKIKSNRIINKTSNDTNLKKKESLSTVEKENRKPKNDSESRLTLQEYLLMNRGEYVNRAEYRRKCVADLTYLRELRNKTKRHLIVMAPESSDYSQSTTPRELPPPPLAMKRVFSQKTMRRQTERKYRQLAEVKNKNIDLKRKEAYRTNRLMAEVFTKKLQKRVLKGETNLSNSVSVISSL
ncbi:hypothetical protein LSTR_LSTR012369 [Laodelphax striatellus]|uniref:ALMS motif domain-containing protein n=1 Tax=Laodelphax striatellus TaxID=195883 RepID=A0A482WKI7_LAOST|nr:hypothetical protein LSTR_LSTR012369 [Laodelphax striatellus]